MAPSGPQFHSPPVTEQEMPGIGRRFDLRGIDDDRVAVVIHHSGRRDLYILDRDGETEAVLSFSDAQARTLGAVLGGAYFQPAVAEEMEAVVGQLLIDWVTLHDSSPGTGRTIADLEVRRRTRMTIAAIMRGGDPIVAPEPSETLTSGDRLVVIGRQEDLAGFRRLVVGADDG